MKAWIAPLAIAALAVIAPISPAAAAATSCVACHANPDLFDETARKIVSGFKDDVHAAAGLSCQDCHGGNPDPALSGDTAAMDPHFTGNPYRGAPKRAEIPRLCGRCHSDPDYMKRFRPGLRVDQEREYATSHHGKALAKGDARVATCVDCHGVHGIRRVADPLSPVYPKRVAETCAHCHADPQRMAGSKLPDGRPLPVDQYARWRQSVHAKTLLEKEDLSAPTCNDCHGNHGAAPPGLDSIALVCGQCHGREAQLFRASKKRQAFEAHNELLAAGAKGASTASTAPQGCAACHSAPEPQAGLTAIHAFGECTSCHGNHEVVRPTVAMLSPLPETPCAFCHEGSGPLSIAVPERPEGARRYAATRDGLLASAQRAGIAPDERFDWLVDQAQALPFHQAGSGATAGGGLSPEFSRLFTKFRIGKVHFTYLDPATGKAARAAVVRCADCHAATSPLTDNPKGLKTSELLLAGMREVTGLTARAERLLLAARRGGVETRKALPEVDAAVDGQIELEVLVHTFSADPQGAFEAKHREASAHAAKALDAGQQALGELAYRRKGLALSLVLIACVLVGLAFKIRQISG
jgi:hypothetical protein